MNSVNRALRRDGAAEAETVKSVLTRQVRSPGDLCKKAVDPDNPSDESTSAARLAANSKAAAATGAAGLDRIALAAACVLPVLCCALLAVLFVRFQHMQEEIVRLNRQAVATNLRIYGLASQTVHLHDWMMEADRERRQTRPSPVSPLSLDPTEVELVRQFIKVVPTRSGSGEGLHVGDRISVTLSAPIPDKLVERVPKLKESRFSIGAGGGIVIIDGSSNRVVRVIDPP